MISEERNTIESRLASVDALRDFTMFWIIGGSQIFRTLMRMWPNPVTTTIGQHMSHLNWGGFCFYDLIFPMFLFIVGVVLPFSISRRLARGQSRTRLHVHIGIRTGLLFLLGLIRDAGLMNFNWFQMRCLSVLSMIAISYFIAAIIVLNTSPKIQGVITGALLIGYCVVLAITGIEIPDDHKTLPSTQSIYCAYACAGTANVLIGALVGHWLGLSQSGIWKTAGLAATSLTSIVAGYIWGIFFPIIRIRWTSSFVLVRKQASYFNLQYKEIGNFAWTQLPHSSRLAG